MVIPLSSTDEESDATDQLTIEEQALRVILTVLIPLLVTGIAFGVIILAYAQWKLY